MILRYFCSASIAAVALGIVLVGFASANADAQPAGITSKVVLRTTLSGDDTKESVMVSAELAPGSTTGRHTHPGDEYTYVLQGTLELSAEGRETRRVSAGEVVHNPGGLVHEARNVGDSPARVAVTFVIDKGKPITQYLGQ